MQLALELKTSAQDRVEANADAEWFNAALDATRYCAIIHATFTSDDVWDRLDTKYPGLATHDPRAMGAVMRHYARLDIITKTGAYTPSRRVECHARPVMVWQSLIHGATNDPTLQ